MHEESEEEPDMETENLRTKLYTNVKNSRE